MLTAALVLVVVVVVVVVVTRSSSSSTSSSTRSSSSSSSSIVYSTVVDCRTPRLRLLLRRTSSNYLVRCSCRSHGCRYVVTIAARVRSVIDCLNLPPESCLEAGSLRSVRGSKLYRIFVAPRFSRVSGFHSKRRTPGSENQGHHRHDTTGMLHASPHIFRLRS